MNSLAQHLPELNPHKKFQHSDERFVDLQRQLNDLNRVVKNIMFRMHRLENRGVDE